MTLECTIVPADTSAKGAAAVPEGKVIEALSIPAAEKALTGVTSPVSQQTINAFCESARLAGSVDAKAYASALEKLKLSVNCQICRRFSGSDGGQ